MGSNGVGKIMIFRMLVMLLESDEGLVCVVGYDVSIDFIFVRGFIGYLFNFMGLYG